METGSARNACGGSCSAQGLYCAKVVSATEFIINIRMTGTSLEKQNASKQ